MKALFWLTVGVAVDALPDWAYWRWAWLRRLEHRAVVSYATAVCAEMKRLGRRQ